MIPIYRPDNPVDLALAESLLTAEDIPYFVHNKHLGGLFPGVQIELLNARTVMVPETEASRAREVLADLMTVEQEPPPTSPRPRLSLGQIFRMLFEVVVFGWFFPAKRRRKDNDDTNLPPDAP
ncbi:MAG: DUF2007 domain-containing protein [Proteobacteria bacterium]|nr:DUF2007 domain-containing protein [Pseudomonadota bacterium]MCL2308164.1 DUF2007 domain-containing protein [Pseudomonadota bacterium]